MPGCILLAILLPVFCGRAQNEPDCTNLEVTSISVPAQTGKMEVRIANLCGNCSSAMNGCVYWELKAIRKTAPFDTIAASQCYCLQTPANKSSFNYTINLLGQMPALNEMRISFKCGQAGCDSIDFAIIVNNAHHATVQTLIYPNPVSDHISVSDIDPRIQKIIITNGSGAVVKALGIERGEVTKIDAQSLKPGLYLITPYDKNGSRLPALRFVKE